MTAFFAMLDANDLAWFDASVFDYHNSQNWWFRDEITAELQRRNDR